MQTRGVWIIELSELDSLSHSDVARIKALMSRTTDRFRPPYGMRLVESPRQCVFAGTVNHSTSNCPGFRPRYGGATLRKDHFHGIAAELSGGITVPGYAAAKGGVAQLARALANEWAAHNVQVNAIAPGYIATDNTEALRVDPVRSSAILNRIPAGRWSDASDLAGAAVYLASPASAYVNGAVLVVDGGWLGR